MGNLSRWHPEAHLGFELWSRQLAATQARGEGIALLAWQDVPGGCWEWEIMRPQMDVHLCGAVAATRHAAIAAAEKAAASIGLLDAPERCVPAILS